MNCLPSLPVLLVSLATGCVASSKKKADPAPDRPIVLEDVSRPKPQGPGGSLQKSACGVSPGSGKSREPYLFTMADVCALDPIVLPADPSIAKETPDLTEIDMRFQEWSRFTESFINVGMLREPLKPGRGFRIFVIKSDVENAQARGNLFFNSALVENVSSESMAFIACHEAAHEARNHRIAIDRELDRLFVASNPDAVAFAAEFEEFKRTRFNEEKKEYLHSQAAVKDLAALWKQLIRGIEAKSQRAEAEADMVAVKICTEIGFRLEELTTGFFDFFEPKVNAEEKGFAMADGRYPILEGKSADDVIVMILMSYMKSHPTPHERLWQFADVFPAFSDAAEPQLADLWRQDYDKQKPVALALSGPEPKYVELFLKLKGAFAQSSTPFAGGCSFGSQLGGAIAKKMADRK